MRVRSDLDACFSIFFNGEQQERNKSTLFQKSTFGILFTNEIRIPKKPDSFSLLFIFLRKNKKKQQIKILTAPINEKKRTKKKNI